MDIRPVEYRDGRFMILDQTKLPESEVWIELKTAEDVWEAINRLRVRGAPAIGVAAAFGICVSLDNADVHDSMGFRAEFKKIKKYLETSRPTAVNLFWALDRMEKTLEGISADADIGYMRSRLISEAEAIRSEDEESCRSMGEYGLELLRPGMGILTHCNAGALATARYGTCLAPVYLGHERGYGFHVFSDETRPLLQGARLTCWELARAGVDVTLICDNMAASVMKKGWIDAVVVGCDRMAANGDGANKIGTSQVAMMAGEFGIPFYMFVPSSTVDLSTADGDGIEIELREGTEIYKKWYEHDMAPEGIKTFNPAFDVTDHKYITAVVTEKGIVKPPYEKNLKKLFQE